MDAETRPRSAPGRLAWRIALALCAGTAVILVAAGASNLHLQRAHLTRLVGLSAERIAETIRAATRDAMLRNDREGLRRTIADIGSQQGVVRIRVFDKRGTIRSSTRPDEVGRLLDVRAEQCTACHQQDRPLERLERADRIRIFQAAEGGRTLGIIAPIHNEAECTTACHAHPAAQKLLGVLDVQLSMGAVDEAVASSERQMLAGLALTGVAVLLLAGGLLWRMVLRPVARLTAAMGYVANGNLAVQVPIGSSDEIGRMAGSWNAMTTELARARSELTEWNRSLEQRVQAKTEELEGAHARMVVIERMASLGKLAAVVAHEINNPLTGIRTYARLLRRRLASAAAPPASGGPAAASALSADPEAERILEAVDAEAGRCGAIVRNLLTFSRTSPVRFAEEPLAPILERCGFLLRHQAEMQGVTLVDEAPADLRAVCDAAQVQQLLLALLINALEATPPGGRVAVAARAAPEGGALLTVSDTGAGIPAENLARVFEPFFTTKEQGKGVGLGLAVAYGIATRHGGTIGVESRVGEGTVFTVRLPAHPPGTGGDGEVTRTDGHRGTETQSHPSEQLRSSELPSPLRGGGTGRGGR
jgi:two-component system NtrC family sensor kinase